MSARVRILLVSLLALVVGLAGCIALAYGTLDHARQVFEADARAAHQLLSQQAAQHESLLSTLTLLQPGTDPGQPWSEQRVSVVYPAVQQALRREGGQSWPESLRERLAAAEAQSRVGGQSSPAGIDLANGRYWIVRRGEPASFALQLDLRRLASEAEILFANQAQTRAWVEYDGERRVLVPGSAAAADPSGWHFAFRQRLAAESLPVELVAMKRVGWLALPWAALLGWCAAVAWAALVLNNWLRLSLHEGWGGALSEPQVLGMSDLLATPVPSPWSGQRGTGAELPARSNRVLLGEPPELAVAKGAIAQASRQSRRAAEVIGRLRQPGVPAASAMRQQAVRVDDIVRDALEFVAPECERLGVLATLATQGEERTVQADPVALEHVVHQLLTHALQALAQVPLSERQLDLSALTHENQTVLTVRNSGPGLPMEAMTRLFDGDSAGRDGSTGLGNCWTLVQGMGGSLSVAHASPRGTVFRLALPLGD